MKSCLRFIPVIQNDVLDKLSAAYYVSEKVRNSFFGQLYLLDNRNIDAFKLVYTDEDKLFPDPRINSHLALFNGRQVGALRIWEINYPDYIKENPEDLKKEFPSETLYRV